MKYKLTNMLLPLLLVPMVSGVWGQEPGIEGFQFQKEIRHEATPVKFQGYTGTCWVYGTLSLLESELLRMGEGRHNLSEMFIVRHNYAARAKDYVRYQGHKKFSAGAEGWDVFNMIARHGIVPEKAYPVQNPRAFYPDHREMDAVLHGIADSIARAAPPLSDVWHQAFCRVLDTYLGDLPGRFQVNDTSHRAVSYADALGIQPENYVTIGSFTHHPFYQQFVFEGADNWSNGMIYNVPLDELIQTMHDATDKGFTFSWVSDVSNRGFNHSMGYALLPDIALEYQTEALQAAWSKRTEGQRKQLMYSMTQPVPEIKVSQKMRQQSFDQLSTTEDHLMHVCGKAYDQFGKPYFIVKNSWGAMNRYEGYIYASQPYVKMHTLSIALHKNAMPAAIKKKLGIE